MLYLLVEMSMLKYINGYLERRVELLDMAGLGAAMSMILRAGD